MAPVTTLTRMFSLAGIGLLNFIGFMMAALGWAIHSNVNNDMWFYLCWSSALVFLTIGFQWSGFLKKHFDMNLLCNGMVTIAVMHSTSICSTAAYSNELSLNFALAGMCMVATASYLALYVNAQITRDDKDTDFGKQK